MAVTFVDGDPNVAVRINNTNVAAGSDFEVRNMDAYPASYVLILKVDADTKMMHIYGTIENTQEFVLNDADTNGANYGRLTLQRVGVDRVRFHRHPADDIEIVSAEVDGWSMRVTGAEAQLNTVNSTGTIARFLSNDTSRATVAWDGTAVALATGQDLTIQADGNMNIHFGKSSGTDKTLKILRTDTSSAQHTVNEVAEGGQWKWYDSPNDRVEAVLNPNDGTPDCVLELGLGTDTRGVLRLDGDIGATPRMPVIKMQASDGTFCYFWTAYNAGIAKYEFRAKSSDPTNNPATGIVIGVFT